MSRIIILLFVLALLLPLGAPAPLSLNSDTACANGEGMFDRFQCLEGCRYKFGGLGAADGDQVASYTVIGWQECLMECERKFWKEREQDSDTSSQDK